MRTNAATHPRRAALAWWAVFPTVGLSLFGFIGWLGFASADGPAWRADPLVAVLALAAVVGSTWYLSHARAERRWRAALDRYAEQQQGESGGKAAGIPARRARAGVVLGARVPIALTRRADKPLSRDDLVRARSAAGASAQAGPDRIEEASR